ncbi:hypothetical protein D3C72_1756610 [compost metagenome]
MQHKLLALQALADIALQHRPRGRGGLHGRIKEAQRVAPLRFGLVHGQVRALEQLLHRLLRVAEQGDPDAGGAVHLGAIHQVRLVQ